MLIRTQTKNKPRAIMAQYKDMRMMSMKLNDAFDGSMFSETARLFKYMIDPVSNVLYNENRKIVGSAVEGTNLMDSDMDFLIIDQTGVKVGYNPQEASTDSSMPYLCLTRGHLTPAGYTKLQIVNNCENIENTILQSLFMHEIKRYNSNTMFLTNRILKHTLPPLNMTNHGPAQTILMSKDKTIDYVLAYESEIIPIDMNSWFERPRLNNWPSNETCELFKTMGCVYVGVGSPKSPEQDFEWRISPTRQELNIMVNLNPTQFRCYILLKLIRKLKLKHSDDGISSYHCKTALFWTIENTENIFWQPQYLTECFLKCLKLLVAWVTEKKCPNYFIPEENMFETKVITAIQLEILQDVITNYFEYCETLYAFICLSNKTMDVIIKSTCYLKKNLLNCTSDRSSLTIYTIQQYIELIKTKPRNACIQEFQDRVSPHRTDIEILLKMLEEKLLCLKRHDHLKSLLESNTFTEKDITANLNNPSKKSHIDHEYCLKLASLAATRGAYSTCDVLLQNLYGMTMFDIHCKCYISFQRDETQQKIKINRDRLVLNNISENIRLTEQSISDILQQFSFCLQFYASEIEAGIVMTPLHFEAHKTVGIPSEMISITKTTWKYDDDVNVIDLVSIHPLAYLYFLQYKNSEMMNKKADMCEALEKLENMNLISLREGTYSHPDTTLNLLGHIYTTQERHGDALQCFRKSWKIEPHYNAVKWHAMFMLFCNLSISEKNN